MNITDFDDLVRDDICLGMVPGRIALAMIHSIMLDRPDYFKGAAVVPHPVYGYTQPHIFWVN